MNTFDTKLGATIIILGTLFMIISLIDYLKKRESINYYPAYGFIKEYEIRKNIKGGKDVIFIYEYSVDNVKYENNIMGYGLGNIHDYEIFYKNKTKVKVYYCKEDPSISVLIKGVSVIYLYGILIGILLVLVGVITINHKKSKIMDTIWNSIWG